MSKAQIAKLERAIIKCALKRLVGWKKDHPEGLKPFGHEDAIKPQDAWNLVNATLKLEAALKRTSATEEKR